MIVKFDKTCPAWNDDPKYNEMFIETQRRYFNDLLKVRGYVTIMEVLHMLTIPFDADSYKDSRLEDLTWFYDKCDVIIFGTVQMDDGSILLSINID